MRRWNINVRGDVVRNGGTQGHRIADGFLNNVIGYEVWNGILMKKALTIGLLLLTVGVVMATQWSKLDRRTGVATIEPVPVVAVRRLQPAGEDEVVRVPSPGGTVEFLYELSNSGTAPLTELHARLFCQCAVTQNLPETIAPGETVQFGFQFSLPQAGIRSERIIITSGSSPKPLAVINAQLYADVKVPHLVIAPDVVHIQVIRGQPLSHDFLVSAIERSDSPRLIQTPTIEIAEPIELAVADVRETPEYDAANVRRVYRLQLRADAASVTRDIAGALHVFEQLQGAFSAIPLKVEVLEPVTLIPKSFNFRPSDVASGKAAIVNVVRRGTPVEGTVRVKEFDRELIDVRRVSNETSRTQRFEVTPKTSFTGPIETQVVFETDAPDECKNELVLLVHLVPE